MKASTRFKGRVAVLAGGVGAARLLRGLADLVEPSKLTVLVNTGDDEEFYGLHVSPDVDTIVYTLAGRSAISPGWGVRGDTFHAGEELDRLYGPGWFRLGDRDLATHIYRSEQLGQGRSLSECTEAICRSYGIRAQVRPVTNDRLRTIIHTRQGRLPFQEYLVKRRARPRVLGIHYQGARRARPAPGVLESIEQARLLIIAPSNPLVSIGPMLAVPGLRRALRAARSRTIAVSPLVNGRAVKGPLAAMLRGLGYPSDVSSIARLYAGLCTTLVVAPGDTPLACTGRGWPGFVEHDIVIHRRTAARRLARFILQRATWRYS